MEPQRIAKMHAADLVCKYAHNGLDLRETRALYAALPAAGFQNDSDGRKADWALRLRAKLKALVAKADANQLRPEELIGRSYPDTTAKRARKVGRRNSIAGSAATRSQLVPDGARDFSGLVRRIRSRSASLTPEWISGRSRYQWKNQAANRKPVEKLDAITA